MLFASSFSGILSENFPGSIYLHQELNFKMPVYVDEEIKSIVEIIDIKKKYIGDIIYLNTNIINIKSGKEVL